MAKRFPMQPMHMVRDVIRFRENDVVRWLLDKGGLDLNDVAIQRFRQEHLEQFYQLIGYSLSGYHELSEVSDQTCLDASDAARMEFGGDVGGCRDNGCEIHVGVPREVSSADTD